jgi:hypothetical protein
LQAKILAGNESTAAASATPECTQFDASSKHEINFETSSNALPQQNEQEPKQKHVQYLSFSAAWHWLRCCDDAAAAAKAMAASVSFQLLPSLASAAQPAAVMLQDG